MNLEANSRLADAGLPAGARLVVLAALAIADDHDVVAVSQADIARAARVSLATASAALRKARGMGLLREIKRRSSGRRKPMRLSLRPMLGKRGRS
jgi:hypothetical protein